MTANLAPNHLIHSDVRFQLSTVKLHQNRSREQIKARQIIFSMELHCRVRHAAMRSLIDETIFLT
jgi:hypothetical protein